MITLMRKSILPPVPDLELQDLELQNAAFVAP
jgi:hypothetical protein